MSVPEKKPDLEFVSDVSAQRIARVYADATLKAADQSGQSERVIAELDSLVNDVFSADPALETYLASRAVSREKKTAVIQSAFGSRSSKEFTNLLLVLNEHDRLDLIRQIRAEAVALHEERTGHVRVEVRSAVPLPNDQRDRLLQILRKSLGKEPVLQSIVDPSLLGGMVVRVGDWLYDASVSTRLDNIRKQLLERSSYEIQSRRDRFCHNGAD
jgi:F-type H+-transporting ATPase subunit delta